MASRAIRAQNLAMGIYRSSYYPMDQYVSAKIFAETCQYYVDEIEISTETSSKNHILALLLEFVSENFYWFKLETTFQKNLKNLMWTLYYEENCSVACKYYSDFYGEKL